MQLRKQPSERLLEQGSADFEVPTRDAVEGAGAALPEICTSLGYLFGEPYRGTSSRHVISLRGSSIVPRQGGTRVVPVSRR